MTDDRITAAVTNKLHDPDGLTNAANPVEVSQRHLHGPAIDRIPWRSRTRSPSTFIGPCRTTKTSKLPGAPGQT